jgi:hypothetical protein
VAIWYAMDAQRRLFSTHPVALPVPLTAIASRGLAHFSSHSRTGLLALVGVLQIKHCYTLNTFGRFA